MKGRFISLIIILSMLIMTWQFGKSRALNQLLNECKDKDATHIDLIFDLEQENAKLNDYIISIEEENAILSSCCANGGLQPDTVILN
jgi:hypothetical protein